MLVLSRRRMQSVIITLEDGREVAVTVVDIRGEKIRIGVEADRSIKVNRSEVAEAIANQQQESSRS